MSAHGITPIMSGDTDELELWKPQEMIYCPGSECVCVYIISSIRFSVFLLLLHSVANSQLDKQTTICSIKAHQYLC